MYRQFSRFKIALRRANISNYFSDLPHGKGELDRGGGQGQEPAHGPEL
jgi:hypothetical protein